MLVSSIEDQRLRSAVKAQLALHMAGLQPSATDLSSFLSSDSISAIIQKPGGGQSVLSFSPNKKGLNATIQPAFPLPEFPGSRRGEGKQIIKTDL